MTPSYAPVQFMSSRPGSWPDAQRAALVVSALRRRHFQAQYVDTRDAAIDAILSMLPEGASVVRSASAKLDQLDVVAPLRRRGHEVTDLREEPGSARKAFFADVYMASATAVTMDGQIISGDLSGSSVAPMIFGPGKVIIVMDLKQIVKDKAAAFERIEAMAGDGEDPRLSYNSTGMLEGALPRFSERINVILVGELLGDQDPQPSA